MHVGKEVPKNPVGPVYIINQTKGQKERNYSHPGSRAGLLPDLKEIKAEKCCSEDEQAVHSADAAPYYRIFNPILQSKKFDAKADYIRRWIPELRELDNKHIHEPSPEQARQCNYPEAMVDLKATRERALERYSKIR